MKRSLVMLLLLLLPLMAANAESAENVLHAAFPDSLILSADEWGDTAAYAVKTDEQMMLVMLERHDELWQVAFTNPHAFLQDEGVPSLLLDTDSALYWKIGWMTFSSFRDASGVWGPVCQSIQWPAGGDVTIIENVLTWNGQTRELLRVTRYLDENENLVYPESAQRIPAPWLEDCIRLADFDVSRYPVFEYEEYDGQWPEIGFIRDAAAYLMPDWTCISGSYTRDECFRFLMERRDGRRIFVGVTADLDMTISTPLPAGTYFGVENFTNWLGHDQDSFYLELNEDGKTWGLKEVMSRRTVSEDLTLSPTHIYNSHTRIVIGTHPWSDVTRIDWSTLPVSIMAAYQKTDSSRWVIVRNPDPADRLHLRTFADRSSASKGKYYTGTPAQVLSVKGDWVNVNIAGQSGWMMKKYLEFGDHLITTAEHMPEFDFRTGSGTLYALAARGARTTELLDTHGWCVAGILGEEWYHIWNPQRNEYGFVLQKDVKLR